MKTTDNFNAWATWYKEFHDRQMPIDWNTMERIPSNIHAVIAHSIKQFQLGESSEAENLKGKVSKFVRKGGDSAYQESLDWFIFEENRHSRLLGRFMNLEGMPKAKKSASDKLFRFLRHFASLRYAHVILVSAEMISVPYYTALRNVSTSPILTTICKQILEDEVQHLRYQAKVIRMHLKGKSNWRKRSARAVAKILLELALDVVWFQHAKLMRLDGYNFSRFRLEAFQQFDFVWDLILTEKAMAEPITAHPDADDQLASRSLSRNALWSQP